MFLNGVVIGLISKYKFVILLIIINIIVFFRWLTFDIFTYADWTFHSSEGLLSLFLPSLWFSGVELGEVYLLLWRAPMNLLFYFFGAVGMDSGIADKLIVFWPSVLVGSIGSFYFCRYFTKNKISAFAGSIIFSFNTYFLAIQTQGHNLLVVAAAFAVVAFLSYSWSLYRQRLYFFAATAILMFVVGSYDFRTFYMLLWMLFFYFIFFLVARPAKVRWKEFIIGHLFLGMCIVLLSLYWILPILMVGNLTENEVLERPLFGNNFWNLEAAINIFHPFWNGSVPEWFTVQEVPLYMWLIPITALLGFLVNFRNKHAYFFAFLSLVGILLSKQVDQPFTELYPWLNKNMPGFGAFREGSKFYLFTITGYMVLIGMFLDWLSVQAKSYSGGKHQLDRHQLKDYWHIFFESARLFLLFTIIAIFGWNALPVMTGEIGTLFTPKEMPQDYTILKDFIFNQEGVFNILTVPSHSKWQLFISEKSRVRPLSLLNDTWSNVFAENTGDLPEEKIIGLFSKEYSRDLLSTANIKYVIVPTGDPYSDRLFFRGYGIERNMDIRQYYIDELDDINFLKKVDIGTKDLVIYENTGYREFINTSSNVFLLESLNNLEGKKDFSEQFSGSREEAFFFTTKDTGTQSDYSHLKFLTEIFNLLENTNSSSFKNDFINQNIETFRGKEYFVYRNNKYRELFYEFVNKKLILFTDSLGELFINNEKVFKGESAGRTRVQSIDIQEGVDYFITLNDMVVPLKQNRVPESIGIFTSQDTVRVLKTSGNNLLPNPSFEDGFWNDQVGDCHNYDDNPILDQRLNSDMATDGSVSLQLEAKRHIACSSKKIKVTADTTFFLSFDFRSPNSNIVGFDVVFNEDELFGNKERIDDNLDDSDYKIKNSHRDISKYAHKLFLPVQNPYIWDSHSRLFWSPADAEDLKLYINSYSTDELQNIVTLYDNFKLFELEEVFKVPVNISETDSNHLEIVELPAQDDYIDIKIRSKEVNSINLIENSSFENSLWAKEVGDCFNFDDNPQINMSLDSTTSSEGLSSLKLEASRHIACTSTFFDVEGGKLLMLNLDYQSPNSDYASVRITFNNNDKEVFYKKIPIENQKWNNFNTAIKIPFGATVASIRVEGFSDHKGTKNFITRYDNVQLHQLPDLDNIYYLSGHPDMFLEEPGSVSYSYSGPTDIKVNINSALYPFFLNMAEKYHKNWITDLGDIPHFKTQDALNTWLVDPEEVCKESTDICSRNTDGSYNIKFTIKFKGDEMVPAGVAISTATLMLLILYLSVSILINRRENDKLKMKGSV